jgi:putative (di)nucleoside polyphosphate hydrolase
MMTRRAGAEAMRYRRNVCTVLIDPGSGRVLVFHRADGALGEHCWQFPQGGVKPGETPREAMLRELEEEVGTARVAVLAQAPHPIRYEFPPEVLARLARDDPEKQGYIGQEQTWFLARLLDGERSIHFRRTPRELDAFRWVTPEEALAAVVPFKAHAYRQGLTALGVLKEGKRRELPDRA